MDQIDWSGLEQIETEVAMRHKPFWSKEVPGF